MALILFEQKSGLVVSSGLFGPTPLSDCKPTLSARLVKNVLYVFFKRSQILGIQAFVSVVPDKQEQVREQHDNESSGWYSG